VLLAVPEEFLPREPPFNFDDEFNFEDTILAAELHMAVVGPAPGHPHVIPEMPLLD
jgi:hypothetical protein